MTTGTVEPSATLINPPTVVVAPPVNLWAAEPSSLDGYLQCYTEEMVQQTLANAFLDANHPTVSALAELTKANSIEAKCDVAKGFLSQLRQQSEQGANVLTAVVRYIQIHQLWRGHGNAVDFLRTLDGHDTIEANIVFAAKLMSNRRAYLKDIEQRWGTAWFSTLNDAIPDPDWKIPECASRDKLRAIANTAIQDGIDLETAISGWKTAIEHRTNPILRRRHKIGGSYDPVLTVADVEFSRPAACAARTAITTAATSTPVTSSPATSSPATRTLAVSKTRRQKRPRQEQQTSTCNTRNTTRTQTQVTIDQHCHGQVLADFLRRLISMCNDPETIDPVLRERIDKCCDNCKPIAQTAKTLLLDTLTGHVAQLKSTTQHRREGQVIPALPPNWPFTSANRD